MAIRGATVCLKHGGGARQVRQKAAERVTLAQALAQGDRRPPFEVISDALHAADVIMRDVRARVENDESANAELLTKFVEALERAARMAKLTIDGKFVEMQAWVTRHEGEEIAGVFQRALARVELSEVDNAALRTAFADEMRKMAESDRMTPAALPAAPARQMDAPIVVEATVVSDRPSTDS